MGWSVEYLPGECVLIASGERLVLLPGGGLGEMSGRLWDLVQEQAGILDVLETLSAHGLSAVPDAGVAVEDPAGCIVLLRGNMAAVTDDQLVDATGRYTWTETQIDVGEFRIFGDRADAATQDLEAPGSASWLPIQSGIVLCSQARIVRHEDGRPESDRSDEAPQDEPRAAGDRSKARGTPVEPDLVGEPLAGAGHSDPLHRETVDAPDADDPSAAVESETDNQVEHVVEEGQPGPEQQAPVAMEEETPDPVSIDSGEAQGQPPDDQEPEDDYDRLFGETSLVNRRPSTRAAEDEAVSAMDGAEAVEDPIADPTETAALSTADSPPQPAQALMTPVASLAHSGLIDAVPGMVEQADPPELAVEAGNLPVPPTLTAPPAPTNVAPPITWVASPLPGPIDDGLQGDHDGRTVLRPSRPRTPAATASVRAIVCGQGHANPPEAVACRVCRMDIGDVPIQTIARPSMGVLRLANPVQGAPDSVDLDRSVVIGRKPHHAAGMDPNDRLVVVDVPGGELSRNHVRVTLEGWHVLVTDLGSTNGTVITVPGSEPVRLRGRDATPISAGTVITLAETVTYRFEVG